MNINRNFEIQNESESDVWSSAISTNQSEILKIILITARKYICIGYKTLRANECYIVWTTNLAF